MALNHNHVIYDNFVLANEIEDQFNSKLDLMQFVTVDDSLEGVAGDKIIVHTYSASAGTQQLEMGEGNDKNIEVSYTSTEYEILLLQNRFPYYDEEEMKDPLVVTVGLGRMASDMFNSSQGRIYNEFLKGTQTVVSTTPDFAAFADAIALLDLPENESQGEGGQVFAFCSKSMVATIRKALKDELKYVESYSRTGYVGTVAGCSIFTKKDALDNTIVVATSKAVKYFVKKGTEVEQERDANVRLNEIYSRKYFVPALVDDTQVARILVGTSVNGPSISTTSLASGTVGTAYSKSVSATGTATITYSIERGNLPDGLAMSDAGAITGTPTVAGTFTFTVLAKNGYGVASKELSITVASA